MSLWSRGVCRRARRWWLRRLEVRKGFFLDGGLVFVGLVLTFSVLSGRSRRSISAGARRSSAPANFDHGDVHLVYALCYKSPVL